MFHLLFTFFLIVVSSLTLHAEEPVRLKYVANEPVVLHAEFIGDCRIKSTKENPTIHLKESFEGEVVLTPEEAKGDQARFPYQISYTLLDHEHDSNLPSKNEEVDAITLFSSTRSEADDEILKKFQGYVVPLKIDSRGDLVLVHPEQEIKFPQISYVEDWLFGKHLLAGVKDLFLLAGKDLKKGEKYPYQTMRKIVSDQTTFEVHLDGTVEIVDITADKVIANLFLNVDSTEVRFKNANSWQEVPVKLSGIWIGKAAWDRENALNFKSEGQGIWQMKVQEKDGKPVPSKIVNCESRFAGRIYTTPESKNEKSP